MADEDTITIKEALNATKKKYENVSKALSDFAEIFYEECSMCDYISENEFECEDCAVFHLCMENQNTLWYQLHDAFNKLKQLVNNTRMKLEDIKVDQD